MGKVNGFIEVVSERGFLPVVSFYFHPWEFYEMPRGSIDYGEASVTPLPFITENCGEVACREFDALLEMLANAGGTFKTAAEIAADYQVTAPSSVVP